MSDEETAGELDGSGYTRSSGGPAEWVNTPGTSWTITARVNAAGLFWLEKPVIVRQDGLKVAAGAITVTLR